MLRYTEEEFKKIKQLEKDTLLYGKAHIIGRYEFRHEVFGEKVAIFTKNSFTENLRYSGQLLFKSDILKNIDTELQNATYSHYSKNYKPDKKPKVDGYFVFKSCYNGREVEYLFENRYDGNIVFYFIKLEKM